MTPVQQLKLIEGMTPRELHQLKLMEERLRREREECDKLRHTIDAIMGDKVDVRRTKLSNQARVSASPSAVRAQSMDDTPQKGKKGRSGGTRKQASVQIMSPLYRPRSSPRNRSKQKQGERKMMYTNFARSPRFAWQKYEQKTKKPVPRERKESKSSAVPDITHLATYRKPLVTPGPGSYDIPTAFSPHKVVAKAAPEDDVRKKALKNQASRRAPRDEESMQLQNELDETRAQVQETQAQMEAVHSKSQQEVDFMREELARRQARLDQAESKMNRMQGSLGQLQALSQDLNRSINMKSSLSAADLSMAQEQAATLNEALTGLSSAVKPEPEAPPPQSAAVSGDDVQSFVEKSVVGSAFRVWEEGNEWTDEEGYKHQGRWVTVHTKQSAAPQSDEPDSGPIQFRKKQHSDTYNRLEHTFDLIASLHAKSGEAVGDTISGADLHDFLHNMRGTEDAQFVIQMLKRARPVHKGGSLFEALDENHDGGVSKYEFIHTLMSTPEKRELVAIFKTMDADGDGVIMAKEMHDFLHFNANHEMAQKLKKHMYKSRKFFLSTNKTHKLFDALDDNHDGAITMHEFLHCLLLAEKQDGGKKEAVNTEPLTTDEKIRHIFRFYCSFGERFQDHMSGPNWSKCVRDVDMKVPKQRLDEKLVDEKNLTLANLGLIFTAAVRYQHEHNIRVAEREARAVKDRARAHGSASTTVHGISPTKKKRITYDTFLFALRKLACTRFPEVAKRKPDGPMQALKAVLQQYILPLYDDEISNSQTSFAKSEKQEQGDLTEYKTSFRPARKDKQGLVNFFQQHAKGLLSIFSRYCSLNEAGSGAGGDAGRFASASWDDIKELNTTMDWMEFNTFIQDFCIVPRLTTRVMMQRIFKQNSSTAFVQHDQYGHVVATTKGQVDEHLTYTGWLDCLGMLSMKLFEDKEIGSKEIGYADQCPTPRSKIELLFFKMERPPWLLKNVEKKLANHIDTAVRGTIMNCTVNKVAKASQKPDDELGEVKDMLAELG